MAARRIHIDCETYRTRNPAIIERLTKEAIEAQPAQNVAKYKKEVWGTQQAINERVSAAIAKTSCNPMYAEILTICGKTENNDELFSIDAMAQSEDIALNDFCEIAADLSDKNTIWTAFNGKRFDFMLLLNRMIKHRIRPPEHFPSYAGNWRGRIFDTMQRIPTADMFTSFVTACEMYGIDCKTAFWHDEPMNGGRVGEAFEAGEYQIIRDYCMNDVAHEEELYLAMTHNDTWGTYDTGNNGLSSLMEIINDDEMSPAYKWATALPIIKQLNY